MKTAGIICEYNPFHTGHKYHIDHIKQDFDAVVCIMSGSFVQRGDIAITDKWTRAGMALDNGADLVIELPVIYSLNTAQKFALLCGICIEKTKITLTGINKYVMIVPSMSRSTVQKNEKRSKYHEESIEHHSGSRHAADPGRLQQRVRQ